MAAADVLDATPRRIGRYELLLPIASGGMATVYLARAVGKGGFQREVALKLTHPHFRQQPEWSTELIEEAKLASRIRHPNVVAVLDVDDDPDGVFLVMEYVAGDTLAGLVRREMTAGGVVPLAIAGAILADALDGLHAAHELVDDAGRSCEVVHRDFSPQNLIVGVDGVTRLTDFGIAKAADRIGFTRTGTIKGKFSYMSPEQILNQPLDRRTDVWAAGVVAWELFTGKRLHPASEQPSVLLSIVRDLTPPASLIRPSIPEPASRAIERALVLEPGGRWPSALAFRNGLAAAFSEAGVTLATREEVRRYVEVAVHDLLTDRAERVRQVTQSFLGARPLLGPAAEAARQSESTQVATVIVADKPRGLGVRSLVGTALLSALVVLCVAFGVVPRHTARGTAPGPQYEPPPLATVAPAPQPSMSAAAGGDLSVTPAPPPQAATARTSSPYAGAGAARAVTPPVAHSTPKPVTSPRPRPNTPSTSEPSLPPLRPNPYAESNAP